MKDKILEAVQISKTYGEGESAVQALKASDPMRWVGLMNACKAQAEEIILRELVYS